MEPEIASLDWNAILGALVAIVILAFFIERALALLFEWRHFHNRLGTTGVKEPLAFCVALLVTWQWQFDALSQVMGADQVTFLGEVITAAVIGGGSKASIKLFRDVAGVRNLPSDRPADRTTSPGPAASESSSAGS
jgi:hypothetical protein